MRDDQFEGLIETTPHRRWYRSPATGSPVPSERLRTSPTGKASMLHQDLHLYALPYGSGPSEGFNLGVVPLNENVSSLIINAIPGRGYRHWQLSDAFRDYVQSASQFLVEGDLFLEISYFRDPRSTSDKPVAFRVEFLFPEMIRRRLGTYRHLAPVGDQVEEPVRWSYKPLDRKRLVVGSLPRDTRRYLANTLRLVRAADGDLDVMSAFTSGRYGAKTGFDFNTYRRQVSDIVLTGSRQIGWTGRGLFTEGLLDPMKAWRAIQFARFVAQVRDVALGALQSAVDRAGAEIGFRAELMLTGVLTYEELNGYEQDLQRGTRPMAELFTPTPRTAE